MTHRFPIKEIALQAGLSAATVDRVLHDRPHVSPQTRARIAAALAELAAQEDQLAARGRRVFVDVVAEAPDRFTAEIRAATLAALPDLSPAVVRPRFAFAQTMTDAQSAGVLARIARRGSQGVLVKLRDIGPVRQGIRALRDRGIPVVTLVTDCAAADRLAYAGLDNVAAGRTAGRLIARHVQGGTVLATMSHRDFAGEEARWTGFRAVMAVRAPAVRLLCLRDAGGLNTGTGAAVAQALQGQTSLAGVYSMGGANRAITATLRRLGIAPAIYVAHDLDADNRALLSSEALDFVLHHDLRADVTQALRHILRFHRLVPPGPPEGMSRVQIILPENMPGG